MLHFTLHPKIKWDPCQNLKISFSYWYQKYWFHIKIFSTSIDHAGWMVWAVLVFFFSFSFSLLLVCRVTSLNQRTNERTNERTKSSAHSSTQLCLEFQAVNKSVHALFWTIIVKNMDSFHLCHWIYDNYVHVINEVKLVTFICLFFCPKLLSYGVLVWLILITIYENCWRSDTRSHL